MVQQVSQKEGKTDAALKRSTIGPIPKNIILMWLYKYTNMCQEAVKYYL